MYKNLFSPIKINTLKIKNRIAYPALGVLYCYDSKLNDRYFEFFREKARGGAGIVTVGPVGIDFIGSGIAFLSMANDEAIADFKKLTDIIREGGASPWIQLFHAGAYSHPILINNETPMAPSPIYTPYSKVTPREMTIDDIKGVQDAFVAAALRAKAAGFDGVEFIGSGGYLITQFLSPLRNQRQDDYGGSFENRVRFPREVIEKARTALGKEFPLGIRMAGNDFVADSTTDAETPAIAEVYEQAGIDVINVTGGWHETKVPQLPMELPRTAYAYLALNVKKAVSVPVQASNRISDPDSAEKIIRDGYADMVNLGRVLIADPFWPQKASEGRAAEIRPCTACGQGCSDMVFSGQPVFCTSNPRAGFEKDRIINKTSKPKNIMVVGAGVAGLEAAVTATQMGHKVNIFDKAADIGGQVWLAGAPPHKQELLELIRYYRTMLNRLEIPLKLNHNVDAEFIKSCAPDHVILATGAAPLVPPIPGADKEGVLNSWEVLRDNPPLGKKVAIIGGGAVGLETAMFVAAKGTINAETLDFLFRYEAASPERLRELRFNGTSRVVVFEMLPRAGKDVGKSTKWVLFDSLKRHKVKLRTEAKVVSMDANSVTWQKNDEEHTEAFDHIIIAAGSKSVNTLESPLAELNIPYTLIGDCLKPGKIDNAIHSGFLAALDIS